MNALRTFYLLIFRIILVLTSVCVYSHAIAASNHAHAHGTLQLTIAMQDNAIEVAITFSAADIIGFEHYAQTEEDIAAAERALDTLETHSNLITFSGGGCTADKVSVDMSAILNQNKTVTEEDHDHDNHPHKEEMLSHSDIFIQYLYLCPKQKLPLSAQIFIFDRFENIHTIEATWISEGSQGFDIYNRQGDQRKTTITFE